MGEILLVGALAVQLLHVVAQRWQPRNQLSFAQMFEGEFELLMPSAKLGARPLEIKEVQFGESPAESGECLQGLALIGSNLRSLVEQFGGRLDVTLLIQPRGQFTLT